MADLLNFAITRQSAVSLSVPRYQIACTVVDSADQSKVIADLTGANALSFPAVLATLTAAQRDDFATHVADWLIKTVAGV